MDKKTADLFMFMGQSNMAGRGISTSAHPQAAPAPLPGAGYEFRAVSAPERLEPLSEPFGRWENRPNGVDDGDKKTGSMVTAFVNAYYTRMGVPVIGVSASKGGSTIAQWQPGGAYLTDAIGRLESAVSFLKEGCFCVRHKFMLWCQGESDGDMGTLDDDYRKGFTCMLGAMMAHGIERCFLVQIGDYNGPDRTYAPMRRLLEDIAASDENVIMVSRLFASMRERGLMKDRFHYFQQAYNEVGAEAGENTADYVLSMDKATSRQ